MMAKPPALSAHPFPDLPVLPDPPDFPNLPDLPSLCLAITERAPLPMATLEGANRIVRYGNPAFCQLVRRKLHQFVGRPFDELLPQRDTCVSLIKRVFQTKKAESYTEQEPSKPHPIFWSYTIWPVQADTGLVNLMIQVTETAAFHDKTLAMNQALILGSVRQHELTEAAEKLNGRLQVEIAERKRTSGQLRLLWEAAEVLLTTDDPHAMLRGLLTRIGPVLGLDTYFNYMVDETGRALHLASWAGVSPRIARAVVRLEFGPTISGAVARRHRPIYVPHVQRSPDPRTRAIKSFGLRAYVCNPLMAGPVLLGTLAYGSRTRDTFEPDELAVLQTITYYVAVACERLQAAGALRVSETRYRRLFEAAHDGVLLLDPTTRKITDANPFMTKLLGYPRVQLIGKELFEIGLLQDESASREMFRKLKRKHEVRYEDLPLESQSGRHQEVEVVANLYQENGHAVIQCNIRDITQRKLAEDQLRRSEAQYRTLFELSPTGVYAVDAAGLIQAFNQHAVVLWGRRPRLRDKAERFCGSRKLFHPDGKPMPHRRCPMAEVLGSRVAEVQNAEVMIERPDRSRIICSVNIRPLQDARGKIVGAINCFYDITARKEAEAIQRRLAALAAANLAASREISRRRKVEASLRKSEKSQRASLIESRLLHSQMRHLTRQIITAQEEERKKISRELHDDVMQTLVGINAALGALTKEAAVNPATLKRSIARTHLLVKNSVTAVHRFARDLRPAVLDDFGLIPALEIYSKELAARNKFQIRLTAPAEPASLDNSQRTVLFRVAQEALANVARHAHATLVELRITEIPGAVRMEVHDNGRSFRVKSTLVAKRHKRLGLLGMGERVAMVGGKLVIESSPRRGTLVRAEIPVSPEEAR